MISFLPLNSHPNPENVLIIGGGDGGVAREVAKHPLVKSITQCEIDQEVINVSKKYLPNMAKGFDSPKMNLYVGDGFEFMNSHRNQFDVIITDSSDPEGPAEALFEKSYYELMKCALKPKGIVCCQGEDFWLFGDLIEKILSFAGTVFPSVTYAQAQTPSYPTGTNGFILCSLEEKKQFSKPIHLINDEEIESLNLKYYDSEVHRASYVLPNSFQKRLYKSSPNYTK
jgi:spermidine synthase